MNGRSIALVTGASSGIGEQFARLLAEAGHAVVAVARNRQALERLALEVHDRHGIEVEVLAADLETPAGVAVVVQRIADGAPLDLVVNNAGFGWYGPFGEQPAASVEAMVAVNVTALALVSRAALASMLPRGRGGLLNVSSTAGFVPGPRGAVYHATKAFVTSLTESLHEEARPHGVRVTALCPGFTPTGFQRRAEVGTDGLPGFAVTDARMVAAAGLAAVERNQAICVPGVPNRVVRVAGQVMPRALIRRVSARVLERI